MRTAVNLDRIGIYERTILTEWLLLGLVLVGVYLDGSSILTVLGERWRSAREVLPDLGIALLFLIVTITITSIIGGHGGSRDSAASFLIPHGGREFAVWIALSISAGICEEAVYRGYLQKQFTALTRNVPAGIILSAAAFGAGHAYQGLRHALSIGLLGAMSGILVHWRRSLRPVMISHTLQDVLGGLIGH
jgi:membrane protease YdiL (CAAX protease family)